MLFRVTIKGIRRKEKPELNDEFAQDLGDFRTVDELKDAIKKSIFSQRQNEAQRKAKDKLVQKLVDANDFAVATRSSSANWITALRTARQFPAPQQGIDATSLNLDWRKLRENMRNAAIREVRASLILGRVAETRIDRRDQSGSRSGSGASRRQDGSPLPRLARSLLRTERSIGLRLISPRRRR